MELPGVEPGSGDGKGAAFYMLIVSYLSENLKVKQLPYKQLILLTSNSLAEFRSCYPDLFDHLLSFAVRTGPRQMDGLA